MAELPAKDDDALSSGQKRVLFILNVVCSIAHLAQGIVILVISEPAFLPVTFGYLAGAPGEGVLAQPRLLFLMRAEIAIAVFLFFAAVDHGLMLVPPIFDLYKRFVSTGRNPFRWIEYSISASIMLVLISLLAGVSEVTALINGFGLNSAMILFGLVQEQVNPRYLEDERVNWWPFVFGSIVGIVPWIAIAVQLGLTQTYCLDNVAQTTYSVFTTTTAAGATTTPAAAGRQCVPPFVFGVFGSLFVCFMSFALNMLLQYLKAGKWKQPHFAEYVYLVLSLLAKSLLAWQVYAGAIA